MDQQTEIKLKANIFHHGVADEYEETIVEICAKLCATIEKDKRICFNTCDDTDVYLDENEIIGIDTVVDVYNDALAKVKMKYDNFMRNRERLLKMLMGLGTEISEEFS